MEDKDILEGNRVIAEFMGAVFEDGGGADENRWYFPENWYYEPLAYHCSWDWLLPVVAKIRDMAVPTVFENADKLERLDYKGSNTRYLILSYLKLIDIEEIYGKVVEFIKWYNKKKELL